VLDHVALEVADLARAARFYDALMHALGGRRIVDSPNGIGYGRDQPELWIMPRAARPAGTTASAKATTADGATPPRRGHVGIAASGRRAVDAAHAAGLAAGGRDGGAPGPRAFGPPMYYSGYLVDPDGAWLELVSGSR
jgi:catechol 2,3-dioxygenase-like lactoylglutathione lyase family enzyme